MSSFTAYIPPPPEELRGGAAQPLLIAQSFYKLANALSPIIRSQDIRDKLFAQGWKAEGTAPDALRTRMRVDNLVYGGIIKKRAIKLEG